MQLYKQITDAVISNLDDAGEWKPCWIGATSLPMNGVTRRRYNGINVLMLWLTAAQRNYSQQRWATYKQWAEAGCQVRKGEKSTTVVLFKQASKRCELSGEDKSYRVARAFFVFNADQCDGEWARAPLVAPLTEGQRHAEADECIRQTGAVIKDMYNQPCYVPSLDEIWTPSFRHYVTPEDYYRTIFHELGHWTGAKHRLDRNLQPRFTKHAYAMEELVAELASAFVSAHCGIPAKMKDGTAAYIKSWLECLGNDPSAIVTAAAAAAKAADEIIGYRSQEDVIKEAA